MKIKILSGLCLFAAALLSNGSGATDAVPSAAEPSCCSPAETGADAAMSSPEMTGSQIGQRAPAFTLKDHNGQEVSLDALLKNGPVALVFIRSADWCLYCKLELVQLQRNLKAIEASGGRVVGISYDPVNILKRFADQQTITFTLLSDAGSKTIDAYDMRNKQTNDGSANHGVFILDQKGTIRATPYLLSSQPDQHNVDILVNALKEARNVNGETKL